MTYGISIRNPGNELVLSSDARGLYCIGKGVLQGAVVQPSGNSAGIDPGRVCGYSVYRLTCPHPPVIALDLPLNKKVSVLSVTSVGAGQWDVKVHCGDTPDIRNIDQVEYQLDIWGYGLAPTIAGRYGLAIFDKTGALAWDLTRDNPLFARSFHSLDDSSVQAIPPLTRPVAVGLPSTDYITDEFVSINRWAVRRSMGALNRTDATTIRGAIFTAQRYEYSNPGEPIEHAQGTSYPANVFIVEGANLP